jgi:hypothetical protein
MNKCISTRLRVHAPSNEASSAIKQDYVYILFPSYLGTIKDGCFTEVTIVFVYSFKINTFQAYDAPPSGALVVRASLSSRG